MTSPKDLPIGTLVSHSSSAEWCRYRKIGINRWAILDLDGTEPTWGPTGTTDWNLGDGADLTVIELGPVDPSKPKVKRKKLEATIERLQLEAVDRNSALTAAVDQATRNLLRAQGAERALRAEREKSVDLGTKLAVEMRKRDEQASVVTGLTRDLRAAQSQLADARAEVERLKARNVELTNRHKVAEQDVRELENRIERAERALEGK